MFMNTIELRISTRSAKPCGSAGHASAHAALSDRFRAARLPEHPKPRIRLEWRPVFHRFPAALQATSDGTCVAFSQRDGAQKPMKQPRANAVSTEVRMAGRNHGKQAIETRN